MLLSRQQLDNDAEKQTPLGGEYGFQDRRTSPSAGGEHAGQVISASAQQPSSDDVTCTRALLLGTTGTCHQLRLSDCQLQASLTGKYPKHIRKQLFIQHMNSF